jgi:hypothetical protein
VEGGKPDEAAMVVGVGGKELSAAAGAKLTKTWIKRMKMSI